MPPANPPPADDATPTEQPRCRMWGCRATLICTSTAATMLECPRCGTKYAVLAKPVTGGAR
jgi:ribosomal protein S27E